MKILIVEDSKEVADALTEILKIWDYKVSLVNDIKAAWDHLKKNPIDFVILDWLLPGGHGTQLIKVMRKVPKFQRLPVLMISGRASRTDIVAAIKEGADGFLPKPFTPLQLKHALAGALKHRRDKPGPTRDPESPAPDAPARPPPDAENRQTQAAPPKKQMREEALALGVYDEKSDAPVIIFGEAADASNKALLRYFLQATEAIKQANAEHAELDLSYIVKLDTDDIVRHIQKRRNRERTKIVFVSMECAGNPLMLVRVLAINEKVNPEILLIVDRPEEVDHKILTALKELGVERVQRQALDQPFFAELIQEHVLLASASHDELSSKDLQQRLLRDLDNMATLPVLPQVYQKIRDLAQDAHSDLKDWARVIQADAQASAVVMHRVRSASMGFQGPISDIERAVVLLGKDMVKDLVLSDAMQRAFQSTQASGFDLEAFWLHNVAVGFAANLLAFRPGEDSESTQKYANLHMSGSIAAALKKFNLPKLLGLEAGHEDPFIGGLMHDIGKAAITHAYPEFYALVVGMLEEEKWNIPMATAELNTLGGMNHTHVGYILARKWELGEGLAQVVQQHHIIDKRTPLAGLVGVADIIGQILYPFPVNAHYPISKAFKGGDPTKIAHFLPEGIFDLLEPKDLIRLVKTLVPNVKQCTEDMRKSVGG